MFGIPAPLVQVDPSRWWFVAAAAICAAPALLAARFKWVIVVSVPAAAGFAAACASTLAARCKDPDVIWPQQPYTWAMALAVALCGLVPLCVLIGTTYAWLGMRKTWSAALALVIWSTPVFAFVSANLVDYLNFRASLRRIQGLGEGQIAAMAERVRDEKEPRRYTQGRWPAEFALLNPQVVHMAPGYSYAPLYRRGDIYLEFAIETDGNRQSAFFFTNCDGPQKEVSLWCSAPAAVPTGPQPLVRLHQYSMHWSRDWIVLPDRVVVIGTKDDDPRSKPTLLAEAALSPDDSVRIAAIIADTRGRLGGRAFMAPVCDGLAVSIHFGPMEGPAPDDILLHNAWTEHARPLFAAVCDRLPAEFRSDFASRIAGRQEDWGPMPVQVLRISDVRDEHPRVPWWCAWPDLLRPDSGWVTGRVGTSHISDPLRYVYRD
ncbi:hypothetical protein DB354_12820 [Opitutus sp. ER46]|nr:hypothetical protein DB354_12820 [Opitutus sp. ER46]